MADLVGWWDDFFWGSVVVAQVFVASLIMMVLFGLIGAAAKLSDNRLAHKIAGAYTVMFRGTPEILVLLIIYFGSAITLTTIAQMFDPSIKFVDVPPFWAGAFAIALIVGAYATETFRGRPCTQAWPSGQGARLTRHSTGTARGWPDFVRRRCRAARSGPVQGTIHRST